MAKPKLVQYWDGAEPPAEVRQWVDGFRLLNPEYDHTLYDEAGAERFIAQHLGPREVAAFRACAMPAMQADYFRLCAIITHGGLYIDADNQCLRPLASLLDPVPHSLMLTWTGLINNAFMMFRAPGNLFLRACLALATENVEQRRFTVENTSTGPGVVNAVRAVLDPAAIPEMSAAYDNVVCRSWGFTELVEHARNLVEPTPALHEAFSSLSLLHTLATNTWIGANPPAYKATDRHWVNWKGEIYRS